MPHSKKRRARAPGPDPSYTCTQAPCEGRGQKVAVVTGCGQGSNQPRAQPGEAGRQQEAGPQRADAPHPGTVVLHDAFGPHLQNTNSKTKL